MNKKTKGLVAGVAGGALLLGAGGTFALWVDQDELGATRIQAGQFGIEAEPLTWWDISPDLRDLHDSHTDTGWTIEAVGAPWGGLEGRKLGAGTSENLMNFRTVPSDTLMGYTQVTMNFEGDNLRVIAELDTDQLAPGLENPFTYMTLKGSLYDMQGRLILDAEGNPVILGGSTYSEAGNPMGPAVLDHVMLQALDQADGLKDGTATALVRVDFTFHSMGDHDEEGIEGQNLYDLGAVLDLTSMPIRVTQDRVPPLS